MRLLINIRAGLGASQVLAPKDRSLTDIQEIMDEEWGKFMKAAVPNSTFTDWLIGNTGLGFTHPPDGIGSWTSGKQQNTEVQPIPLSHRDRINSVVEGIGKAQHDLTVLADKWQGSPNIVVQAQASLIAGLLHPLTGSLRSMAKLV